jgi:hypothetical protein
MDAACVSAIVPLRIPDVAEATLERLVLQTHPAALTDVTMVEVHIPQRFRESERPDSGMVAHRVCG